MEKINQELKEQIKIKLGSPVRVIELEDEHFDVAFNDAHDIFELNKPLDGLPEIKTLWIKQYTLANCKEYLGRIRGKFGGVVGQVGEEKIMDHETLLSESQKEKTFLIGRLIDIENIPFGKLIENPKRKRDYKKDKEICLSGDGEYFNMLCFYTDGDYFNKSLESIVKSFKKIHYDDVQSFFSSGLPTIFEFNEFINKLDKKVILGEITNADLIPDDLILLTINVDNRTEQLTLPKTQIVEYNGEEHVLLSLIIKLHHGY